MAKKGDESDGGIWLCAMFYSETEELSAMLSKAE